MGRCRHVEPEPEVVPAAPVEEGVEYFAGEHPALTIWGEFQSFAKNEVVTIIPYSIDLMALDLLSHNKKTAVVRDYIEWHLTHLNYPDMHGFTGSIYDWTIDPNGKQWPLEQYDSVDSYSALLLILVERYMNKTGDQDFVRKYKQKLLDVAYTIVALQDEDGLTWAIPNLKVKYLMDNCEAYGGLKAFDRIATQLSWQKETTYYSNHAESIANGIRRYLYNRETKTFHWALLPEGPSLSTWTKFYPDAYAQIFPVYYGVLENLPDIRTETWRLFTMHHPNAYQVAPLEQRLTIGFTRQLLELRGLLD